MLSFLLCPFPTGLVATVLFPKWCGQYEVHSLPFLSTPLVLSYYSRFALQWSADNQTCIWTKMLTTYMFMAGVMLITNAMDGACPSCYTYNDLLDRIKQSVPLR